MAGDAALGTLAAASGPFFMTIGFIWWERWPGSAFSLNLYKCLLGSLGFLLLSGVSSPNPFSPATFPPSVVQPLFLSGLLGIVIGDVFWLRSLSLLGARRTILLDSLKPFFAALLGYSLLGEEIGPLLFVGMAVATAGTVAVAMEGEKGGGLDEGGGGGGRETRGDNRWRDFAKRGKWRHERWMKLRRNAAAGTEREEEEAHAEEEPAELLGKEGGGRAEQRGKDDKVHNYDEDDEDDNDDDNDDVGWRGGRRRRLAQRQGMIKSISLPLLPSFLAVPSGRLTKGYLYASANVAFDCYGAVLTKQHGKNLDPWEVNVVRFGSSALVCLAISAAMVARDKLQSKKETPIKGAAEDSCAAVHPVESSRLATPPSVPWYYLPSLPWESWRSISLGVFFVTFLTPLLSSYALFRVPLAVALTLGALGPLYSLPLLYVTRKEKASGRAVVGTLTAVAGVAIMTAFGKV